MAAVRPWFDLLGTYAEVWKAIHKVTGEERAVKIIKKSLSATHPRLMEFINVEIVTLARIVTATRGLTCL